MDVVMQGLNGFQATRQITKDPQTGHIPVILISSKNQETDRQWGMRQGAKDYLVKPIGDSTLINTINGYLN
jgi:twitching motility two-component system response regulator PilH